MDGDETMKSDPFKEATEFLMQKPQDAENVFGSRSESARFIRLALCAFASCPPLCRTDMKTRIGDWLQSLIQDIFDSSEGTGYAEMLLLVAMHFQHGNVKVMLEHFGFCCCFC